MARRIIETAKEDLFVPAPTIVERAMEDRDGRSQGTRIRPSEVFVRILELLPSPPVAEMLVASRKDSWRGAKSVLCGMRIHGCAFHWGQAMDYNKRGCVYRFVRKPFVLPFQPEEQISVTFDALSTIAYKLYREDLDQPNHQRGLYTAWL
uniref:Uncharacterized protein n=1 Tax=Magallana gigas TaxID=29159 RepID=A0A8W8IRL6_MAGGI